MKLISPIIIALACIAFVAQGAPSALNETSEDPIKILFWSHYSWLYGGRPSPSAQDSRCIASSNHGDIDTADMVVFTWDVSDTGLPPLPRKHGVTWMYFSIQSPVSDDNRNDSKVALLNGSINALMSYQRAANITIPYGSVIKRASPLPALPADLTNDRTSDSGAIAVIVLTNCHVINVIYQKLTILQKHINIDTVGRCFKLDVSQCETSHSDCMKALSQTHYFYIAFENGDCDDYTSEKVWQYSFENGLVPILWSSTIDYKAILPPHSYINVADFPSIEQFAQHVMMVASSKHEYGKYHEWRLYYDIRLWYFNYWTYLCDFAVQTRGRELPAIDIPRLRTCGGDSFSPLIDPVIPKKPKILFWTVSNLMVFDRTVKEITLDDRCDSTLDRSEFDSANLVGILLVGRSSGTAIS